MTALTSPPAHHFDDPSSWTVDTITSDDYLFAIPDDALAEILDLAHFFERNPIMVEAITPDDFDIPAIRQFMKKVEYASRKGPRFALIDRLPIDDISDDAAVKVYWVLMSLMSRPVAQTLNGVFVFPVEDTGRQFEPGSGVRPATTNMEQNFHNDNCFNGMPPDFVTLLCVHPAVDGGGVSRVVSLTSVHNNLVDNHPDVLERLFDPFHFDRQKEHPEGEPLTISQPIFSFDDVLKVRLGNSLVRSGYAVKGESLDEKGQKALDVLTSVVEDPKNWLEFSLERGQIEIANNRETGHARSGYHDDPSKPRRRLERLWLRDEGRRTYLG